LTHRSHATSGGEIRSWSWSLQSIGKQSCLRKSLFKCEEVSDCSSSYSFCEELVAMRGSWVGRVTISVTIRALYRFSIPDPRFFQLPSRPEFEFFRVYRSCVLRIPLRLSYAVSQHDGGFLAAAVLVGVPGITGTLARGWKSRSHRISTGCRVAALFLCSRLLLNCRPGIQKKSCAYRLNQLTNKSCSNRKQEARGAKYFRLGASCLYLF
jgi:hypothetical protein